MKYPKYFLKVFILIHIGIIFTEGLSQLIVGKLKYNLTYFIVAFVVALSYTVWKKTKAKN